MSASRAVRERPIPFSGRLVRAILDGRKTVTRRVPAHPNRYGVPGDRLYVTETFMHTPAEFDALVSMSVPYARAETIYRAEVDPDEKAIGIGWKPPRFMRRELSRILLEVVENRVERLQDITDEEAVAEGVAAPREAETCWEGKFVGLFRETWDRLNAARGYGWDANPEIRVVRFRRIEP